MQISCAIYMISLLLDMVQASDHVYRGNPRYSTVAFYHSYLLLLSNQTGSDSYINYVANNITAQT